MAIGSQLKKAWNAFTSSDQQERTTNNYSPYVIGPSSHTHDPERPRGRGFSDKTIIDAVYTRLAIDFAGAIFMHVELDELDRFKGPADSSLNHCLLYDPNVDQGPRSIRQDMAMTMFEHGAMAIVPVETSVAPNENGRFDVTNIRIGNITEWFPQHVRVSVYNELKGKREEIILEKKFVAIAENPLYIVMNKPNGTLQRLLRKLQLLDIVDETSASGRLDLIIQLPYTIRTETKRKQAEDRKTDIEMQLKGSDYGIAYTDGTEKITQLNRPTENNLLPQVERLTKLLYDQLGLTEGIMNGTASEAEMINYYNRTIEPLLDAVAEATQRTFLGPIGIRNNERIQYFQTPFKFVPLSEMSIIADKLARNEIVTPNEFRGFIGLPPSPDKKADELRNRNMPLESEEEVTDT